MPGTRAVAVLLNPFLIGYCLTCFTPPAAVPPLAVGVPAAAPR